MGCSDAMQTAIIIVNWNCWEDTARCLAACLKLDAFSGAIFVLDNDSDDGSFEQLKGWLEGRVTVEPDTDAFEISDLVSPINAVRPLKFCGTDDALRKLLEENGVQQGGIYLFSTSENRGFAGGNNLAIKIAQVGAHFDFFWLLNPDAVPKRDALKALISHIDDLTKPVVAGSVLLEYWKPQQIQAVGASFDKKLLVASHNKEGLSVIELPLLQPRVIVDYPVGASLVLNNAYIQQYGLLEEAYFLYFEEIDLSIRVPSDSVFVVSTSQVYHKGGAATDSGRVLNNRSAKSDYYYIRARLMFSKKLGWISFLTAIIATIYSIFKRILTGNFVLVAAAIRGCRDGVRGQRRPTTGNVR